jgi:LysR family transcriptional regulator, cyn operon transcriptional activator
MRAKEQRARPDLPHLSTFLAVVESGGFGRAAQILGLSQPAVSHRIGRLEAQLGAPLFEQPRRRIILTDAGRRLKAFCVRFLSELDVLTASIAAGTPPDRMIRVACPGAFGRYVVFPLLAHPALAARPFELLFRELDDILDLVEAGDVDVGIAYDARVTRTLAFRRIATEEFVLISEPGSAPPPSTSLDGLARRRFVTYEECDYVFGRWFDDVYGASPSRLSSSYSFSRIEEVVASVAAGRGDSIVPLHSATTLLEVGEVRVFRPEGRPRCLNPEYAVTRPGWKGRPEVDALLAVIEREHWPPSPPGAVE